MQLFQKQICVHSISKVFGGLYVVILYRWWDGCRSRVCRQSWIHL